MEIIRGKVIEFRWKEIEDEFDFFSEDVDLSRRRTLNMGLVSRN